MIRAQWANYERDGLQMLEKEGIFRAFPQMQPSPAIRTSEAAAPNFDVLEYRIEHSIINNEPMSRVLCEGIEVAVFPRLRPRNPRRP